MPCFASMDIAAAFPSLLHDWLWEVLGRWGFHGQVLTLLKACYEMPLAFLEMGGIRRPLLFAASGVAQGCPLSGTLCALVFDPFIR
eukprot:5655993-Pyramimonas_sp.AAC.1